MWRIGCLWACAVAAGAAVADAQVVVHLKDGQKMVGESVLREGDFVFDHPTYKGQVHVELHKGPARGAAPRLPAVRPAQRNATGPPRTGTGG
jgi:hypothetical protein